MLFFWFWKLSLWSSFRKESGIGSTKKMRIDANFIDGDKCLPCTVIFRLIHSLSAGVSEKRSPPYSIYFRKFHFITTATTTASTFCPFKIHSWQVFFSARGFDRDGIMFVLHNVNKTWLCLKMTTDIYRSLKISHIMRKVYWRTLLSVARINRYTFFGMKCKTTDW